MFRLLLIRPGATEYDQQGRIQGTLDIPLSEDGVLEAEELSRTLANQPLQALYSSEMRSAADTAKSIAVPHDMKVKTSENISNVDHGLWQGLLIDDVKKKHPKVFKQWQDQPETICPPQGESLGEVKDRVQSFLTTAAKKHKSGGLIGLVVSPAIAAVVRYLVRQDRLDNCYCASRSEGKPWELVDFKEAASVP